MVLGRSEGCLWSKGSKLGCCIRSFFCWRDGVFRSGDVGSLNPHSGECGSRGMVLTILPEGRSRAFLRPFINDLRKFDSEIQGKSLTARLLLAHCNALALCLAVQWYRSIDVAAKSRPVFDLLEWQIPLPNWLERLAFLRFDEDGKHIPSFRFFRSC